MGYLTPLRNALPNSVAELPVIDSIGTRCPQPIIDAARFLRTQPIGTAAILLSDDPATAPDILAWARMTHNYSEQLEPAKFLVRKESDF